MVTIGKRIVLIEEVESIYSSLMEQNNIDPHQHGDVLLTDFQSAGRGLANNSWESENGKNLLVSFFLKPENLEADKQFYLNIAVSLSVYHTVKHFINSESVTIKWPNDIYVDQQKIAGILISHTIMGSSIEHSVVGIGLNVNQQVFLSDAPNPVSMIHFLKKEISKEDCLLILIEKMNRYYSMLDTGHFQELHNQYTSALFRLEQWRDYLYQTEKIRARIINVLPLGQIELETTEGQIILCNFKEIEFVL